MPDSTPPASRRGRPRSAERIQRVLDAAASQFLQLGFDRTSMESVAQEAGVSKVTVYTYYPSKDELFSAVVSTLSDKVAGMAVSQDLDANNPGDALKRMGAQFLLLMRDEQVVAQQRMLFNLAGKQEKVCRTFYDQGPARIIQGVASYLEAAHKAQSLRVEQPLIAADQFLSLLLGAANFKLMLGLQRADPAQDLAHIDACVDTFLRAFAPAKTPGGGSPRV
nr:TetR/AcrR family transcriptional regulator [Aquabacterium sp. CECT 9606]